MSWQQHFEIMSYMPGPPDYERPSPYIRTKLFIVCSRSDGEPFGMYDTHQAAQTAAKEIAEHWSHVK